MTTRAHDVVVIGAGQAGLAAGYYLRRDKLDFVILDAQSQSGGAWQHTWPSLHLFSPARWSSLPGWMMPATATPYPTRADVLHYLAAYEARYELPIERPVRVLSTHADGARIRLETDTAGSISAGAVISATGSWTNPDQSLQAELHTYAGSVRHSAHYDGPESFAGQRVLVVGGGNSGAQIFAELVDYANVSWVTREAPVFLPDEVDGRVLFDQATVRYHAIKAGQTPPPPRSLGDVVMVESVKHARDRGLLVSRRMFSKATHNGVVWPDGSEEKIDAMVLCTGFKPALRHLAPLAVANARDRLDMEGRHAAAHPRLFPHGYGDWTGFASATLVGAGRSARELVTEIAAL
jgi:putative flavoprotein involved in K+ transport